MTPQQEIALREGMAIHAERENRRMRMICRPVHPNAGKHDYGETTRHKVWATLTGVPLTSDQIADAIGANRSTVQGLLRSMVRTGAAVQETTNGVHRWSRAGARTAGASAPVTPEARHGRA